MGNGSHMRTLDQILNPEEGDDKSLGGGLLDGYRFGSKNDQVLNHKHKMPAAPAGRCMLTEKYQWSCMFFFIFLLHGHGTAATGSSMPKASFMGHRRKSSRSTHECMCV